MNLKAQSEVIGVILLLSISITAIAAILLFGQPIITGAQEDVRFDRMENEFSLLDASMSSSVLGASQSQSTSLNVEGGRLESNPNASWMNVTYENPGGGTETLANITIGNLRYEQNGKTLAYEGGGVWRSNEGENFSYMVSSPEFHYRGATLTLPAYNIKSEKVISGSRSSVRIESSNDPELVFPDEDLDNPLQKGNVTITIKSNYYKGWESFFGERTTGAIDKVIEDEKKVVFSLEVPTELLLNKGIKYQSPGGAPDFKNGASPTTGLIDADLPSTDSIIQPELDKCLSGTQSNCVDIKSLSSTQKQNLDEDKIYYANGDYKLNEAHEASNGNVTILVENNLRYKSNFRNGGNNADPIEVYAGNHLDLQGGNINRAPNTGNSSKFITYIGGEINGDVSGWSSPGSGKIKYTGVIYAPNTDMGGCPGGGPGAGSNRKIAGNANIKGTLVGENICVQGASTVEEGENLNLDLSSDVSLVRYLHITENEVRLSG